MIDHKKPRRMMEALDLDALLRPGSAFKSPHDVLTDPDLTIGEKRAILASWASDACAVASSPELRAPNEGKPVAFDDIMDALKTLDEEARAKGVSSGRERPPLSWKRRRTDDSGETPPVLGI